MLVLTQVCPQLTLSSFVNSLTAHRIFSNILSTSTLKDWDNLTLLFQRVGQAGLECCANPHDDSKEDKNKLWTPIDPVENGIAVNIGDMLARWSGHRVHSNLHRVRSKLQFAEN